MIRELVVDDHDVVRAGLRLLLGGFDDVECVGDAADGQQAVDLVGTVQPDVVLMDLSMPGMSGIAATSRTERARRPTKCSLAKSPTASRRRSVASPMPTTEPSWRTSEESRSSGSGWIGEPRHGWPRPPAYTPSSVKPAEKTPR